MIKAYICNYGEFWGDDVGAIQPPTKSHFNDGNIYLLVGKVLKRQCGGQFKERRVEGFEEILFFFYKFNNSLLVYAHAIDANALSKINQMR